MPPVLGSGEVGFETMFLCGAFVGKFAMLYIALKVLLFSLRGTPKISVPLPLHYSIFSRQSGLPGLFMPFNCGDFSFANLILASSTRSATCSVTHGVRV